MPWGRGGMVVLLAVGISGGGVLADDGCGDTTMWPASPQSYVHVGFCQVRVGSGRA